MIWPRTRGATPTTLARAAASFVRGCLSLMAQTQSVSAAAPKTVTILKIRAATFCPSLLLEDGAARSVVPLGGVFPDGCDATLIIGISVFEKDQPHSQGKEKRQTGKNQGFDPQMRVNSEANQHQSDDEGADKTNDNALQPCGKIGAQHIHRGRMSTTAQQ